MLSSNVQEILSNGSKMCLRKKLYGYFEKNPASVTPGLLCCTYCHSICTCDSVKCPEPIPIYEAVEEAVPKPARSRKVKAYEKAMITDMLEDYMSTLVPDKSKLFTDIGTCTGFSSDLIEVVVKQCRYIFDLDYILENIPVFRSHHAVQILHVISEVFGDIDRVEPSFLEESFPEPDLDFMGYFDEDNDISSIHSESDV